jgi:Cu+-exporting ATPase
MPTHEHAHAATEVIDPVCGMSIDPADAVGHVEHAGRTYYFCSQSCHERFVAAPEKFAA